MGSAACGQSEVLAEIYAVALEAKGIRASTRLDIGAREAYIGAVRDGSIDLFPEYTGNLLQYFDPNATATTPSIRQKHLVTLADPKNLFAAQNIIPLIRHDARTATVDAVLDAVLDAVSAKLTTDALLKLNETFAGDAKPTAADVAHEWLKGNHLA